MSEIKWIKITTDMFDDEKIDFIASLPDSDAIIVIWIRLLTLAGKCNAGGYIYLTEKIPYTEEMIAHKFKKPLNTVKMALETFRRLDMLDMEDNIFFLPNWEKHQNIDGMEKIREQNRKRKQLERQKKRELLPPPSESHVTVTVQSQRNHATEVDKELDIDINTSSTTETISDVNQKIFGTLHITGLLQGFIVKYKGKGFTDAFIKEVLWEAAETCNGGKPSMKYIESIAERWERDKIYSRYQNQAQRKAGEGDGETSRGRSSKVTPLRNPRTGETLFPDDELDELNRESEAFLSSM